MATLYNCVFIFIFQVIIIRSIHPASVLQQSKLLLDGVQVHQELNKHSEEFNTPEIIQVNKHVYVGVGYGIANCIFILAPDGIIVVDTMESTITARAVLTDFRKRVQEVVRLGVDKILFLFDIQETKPIKAIVYTHFHGDHNSGTRAFIEDSRHPPDIWAHSKLAEQLQTMSVVGPILFKRGIRQFGFLLPQELPWYLNNGIGPSGASFFNDTDREVVTSGIYWPNKFVEGKEMDVTIAGLQVKLVNIPGETLDHLGLWIPSLKTFLCGDNLYKTYPNIYTIRGTVERDALLWVESLDQIRRLKPEYLVPSHTKPVIGRNNVMEVVTTYRDGIQILHDQTLRFVNMGYHPVEAARKLQLPPKLQQAQYLQQYYGTIEWSSRAVHHKYFGWFSAKTEELSQLTPKQESKRVVRLGGGLDNIVNKAITALQNNDYQWALELSTHVLRVEQINNCTRNKAMEVRKEALKGLAELQSSPNGRYFYLTTVLEDSNTVQLESQGVSHFAKHLPLERLFRFMSFWLKPEVCASMKMKILFNFTDTDGLYLVHLRNGITETKYISDTTDNNISRDCDINGSSDIWRNLVGNAISQKQFFNIVHVQKCNRNAITDFLKCFEFTEL